MTLPVYDHLGYNSKLAPTSYPEGTRLGAPNWQAVPGRSLELPLISIGGSSVGVPGRTNNGRGLIAYAYPAQTAGAIWAADTFPANQWAQFTNNPTIGAITHGVMLRHAPYADTGYYCLIGYSEMDGAGDLSVEVYRRVNGVSVRLASVGRNGNWFVDDWCAFIRFEVWGSNPVNLRVRSYVASLVNQGTWTPGDGLPWEATYKTIPPYTPGPGEDAESAQEEPDYTRRWQPGGSAYGGSWVTCGPGEEPGVVIWEGTDSSAQRITAAGQPGIFTSLSFGLSAFSAGELTDVPQEGELIAAATLGVSQNATYTVAGSGATFGATLGAQFGAVYDPPAQSSTGFDAALSAHLDAAYAEAAGGPTFGATFGAAADAESMPALAPSWLARVARSALSWVAGPFQPLVIDYSGLLQFAFGAGFSADARVDYAVYEGFPARLDFLTDGAFGPAHTGETDFPWTAGAAFDAAWDDVGPRPADTDLYARPIPVGLEADSIPATLRARVHPVTVRCGMATAMVYQGDDVDVHFEARDSDGNTIDITGAVLTCEADVEGSADNAVGIAAARFWIDDGPRGVCRARFTSAQTAAMTARKTYLYDGRIRMPDNQVHTIGSGSFKVLAAKTPTPT